jgi:hypothetical protein
VLQVSYFIADQEQNKRFLLLVSHSFVDQEHLINRML